MIEVIDEGPWTRPTIDPTALDRPYFEAAAQGALIIQACPECDHRQFIPKPLCTRCGAEPVWTETAGIGEIHTFTIIRRHGVEPFASMVPFVLAMIELPEGVRIMGNVGGTDPDDVWVGQGVEAYALRIDDSLAMPLWRVTEQRRSG